MWSYKIVVVKIVVTSSCCLVTSCISVVCTRCAIPFDGRCAASSSSNHVSFKGCSIPFVGS